jgi:phosphoribosylglycinamide formyltransferase-1
MLNIAVFVSGTGSLLEAMVSNELNIKLVLADRKCRGLEIARSAGIETHLLERTDFSPRFDSPAYTNDVSYAISRRRIHVVAMAGFMTILDPLIFKKGYRDRILNIHPALLPAFKGHHAVRDALAYGVKITGSTVHIATEELDAGRIIAQEAVPVLPDDTESTLHERIKKVERVLYPRTILQFANNI